MDEVPGFVLQEVEARYQKASASTVRKWEEVGSGSSQFPIRQLTIANRQSSEELYGGGTRVKSGGYRIGRDNRNRYECHSDGNGDSDSDTSAGAHNLLS
ncbi:GM12864 [Drosophila sechellia]|uniref:GM12864 n=1 Tax=Drosophila sechellia TaxID=7238 RepID=B4HZM6_DROSE|nr:GM12864 [Drosophila sechellia]